MRIAPESLTTKTSPTLVSCNPCVLAELSVCFPLSGSPHQFPTVWCPGLSLQIKTHAPTQNKFTWGSNWRWSEGDNPHTCPPQICGTVALCVGYGQHLDSCCLAVPGLYPYAPKLKIKGPHAKIMELAPGACPKHPGRHLTPL